jgi:hypothetical protein
MQIEDEMNVHPLVLMFYVRNYSTEFNAIWYLGFIPKGPHHFYEIDMNQKLSYLNVNKIYSKLKLNFVSSKFSQKKRILVHDKKYEVTRYATLI